MNVVQSPQSSVDKPHILFARTRAPRRKGMDGGGVTSVWLIDYLVAAGYRVSVLYLEMSQNGMDGYHEDERTQDRQNLLAMGVSDILPIPFPAVGKRPTINLSLPHRVVNAIRNRLALRRRHIDVCENVAAAVHALKPDICFVFSEVLEYFKSVKEVPCAAWLPHTGEPYRKIQIDLEWLTLLGSRWLGRVTYPLWLYCYQRRLARLVKGLDGGLLPSFWYAKRYQDFCRPPPVFMACAHPAMDEAGDLTLPDPCAPPSNQPFRVVLVGNLIQSLTSAGLAFLGDEIIPALRRLGSLDRFEFVLIGKFEPRPDIAARLEGANVRLAGYVDNLADEVNRADIVLHPVPYSPGAGVRLCSMASMYPCFVLHAAVADSFEELRGSENCLVARTGDEFAAAMLHACEDRALNSRLRQGARAAFDTHYRLDRFGPVLEDFLMKTIDYCHDNGAPVANDQVVKQRDRRQLTNQ